MTDDDAVVMRSFADQQTHDAWVATQIAVSLDSDELEHDDILIVLPDAYRAKSRAPQLMSELARKRIKSHLVGVNTSVDEVFQSGSVAIAHTLSNLLALEGALPPSELGLLLARLKTPTPRRGYDATGRAWAVLPSDDLIRGDQGLARGGGVLVGMSPMVV